MRKAIFILLVFISGSASAEWVAIGGNKTTTVYADPATIRKSAGTVTMRDLYDFKEPESGNGKRFLSQRSLHEFDCKGERARIIYLTYHSQNMGEGETVHLDPNPHDWTPVPAGTTIGRLWRIACETNNR